MNHPKPRLCDLNFKVHPSFRLEFKMTASACGISMKELLALSFKSFLREPGRRSAKRLIGRLEDNLGVAQGRRRKLASERVSKPKGKRARKKADF
jgi:hypothetical protein